MYDNWGYNFMKTLENKPSTAKEAFHKKVSDDVKGDSLVTNEFQAFGAIDSDKEGIEVGLMNTEKFHFSKPGDRLVGFLKSRKQINMGDGFIVYEVYNKDGDWSFSGSNLVDGRMEEIPDGVILDITYTDNRMSGTRNQPYKNYKLKFFPWPHGVDPYKIRCGLSPDGKKILSYDFPSDLGATPNTKEGSSLNAKKG